LLSAYREVHLVDLDAEALRLGVERQGVAGHPALRTFGNIDLTGMLETLATFTPASEIRPECLAALSEWPALRVLAMLGGPYDVVASTCLLSPLIGNAFHAVGESHPGFMSLVQSIRAGHLRLLAALAVPGGTVMLITDVSSSDLVPELRTVSESSLGRLLPRLARDRQFFHGVSPEVLWSLSEQLPVLRDRLSERTPIAPWRWRLHARVYLVWALTYRATLP
jgi:hypothetical protein